MQKTVYDRDGLPGIYVPLNIKAEATKEAADEVVRKAQRPAAGYSFKGYDRSGL